MRRYLREIEFSGMLLMVVGVVLYRFASLPVGGWICGVGILLWVAVVVYKAFRWREYRQSNIQNIIMMLAIIAMLFYVMITART